MLANEEKCVEPSPSVTNEYVRLVREVEEFLYEEADILDQRRFEEWLELFTDDVHYWMPMHKNVIFGEQEREQTLAKKEISWFDEGKETLVMRVTQLNSGV